MFDKMGVYKNPRYDPQSQTKIQDSLQEVFLIPI